MRVLLYNFVQPNRTIAGGVGVYQKNLARTLACHGHDVILMSSGDKYSMLGSTPKLEFSRDAYNRAIIVNSPVFAPAVYNFAAPEAYTRDGSLDGIPEQLRRHYGKIDVFHFQNVEGLTKSFFYHLKRWFPEAGFILSAHNYYFLCPRVTLWHQDRMACEDYHAGSSCTVCRSATYKPRRVLLDRRFEAASEAFPTAALMVKPGLLALRQGWRAFKYVRQWLKARSGAAPDAPPSTSNASSYAEFRESSIELCRTVFDYVLAVSERTRQVIVNLGVPAEKTAVLYIGTAHKAAFDRSRKIHDIGAGLHVAYLGYMTRDKGFHFLVDCLERLPAALAASMTVTVAAKNTDPEAFSRLQAIGSRLRGLRYFNGYTHDALDTILDGVNVGLVPVLWEDNLPQVAIEFVSRGIPILTSDRGGAQEIANNRRFVFRAGSQAEFIERLAQINNREISLAEFWTGEIRMLSMEDHLCDLMRYYDPGSRASKEAAADLQPDTDPAAKLHPITSGEQAAVGSWLHF